MNYKHKQKRDTMYLIMLFVRDFIAALFLITTIILGLTYLGVLVW